FGYVPFQRQSIRFPQPFRHDWFDPASAPNPERQRRYRQRKAADKQSAATLPSSQFRGLGSPRVALTVSRTFGEAGLSLGHLGAAASGRRQARDDFRFPLNHLGWCVFLNLSRNP